jgi:hypothetical protein
MRLTVLRLASGFLTLLLGACGGGGGDAGGGSSGSGSSGSSIPATPQTSFSVSATTLNVMAPINHGGANGTFNVVVQNIPEAGLYYGLSSTTNAIATDGVTAVSSGGGLKVNIAFRVPYQLGVGTYSDTVRVRLCFDSACTNLVGGAPQEVSIQFTVGAPDATISPVSNSIAFSAFVTETSANAPLVSFSFTGMPIAIGRFSASSTNNGIERIEITNGGFSGWITIWPKVPGDVGPGTYTDTLTLTACFDAACNYPLANSPMQIPVTYVVNDTVLGGAGYTVKLVRGVTANTFDVASNGLVYAGTAATSLIQPDSIIVVDPASSLVTGVASLGAEPTVIDVTDDSTFSYVGFDTVNSVKRYALPALVSDATIALGTSSSFGPLYAKDLQAAPGNAGTVAVVRGAIGSFSNELVIFDNTISRAIYSDNTESFNLVRWGASPNQIFVGTSEVSTGAILDLSVNTSNLAVVTKTNSVLSYDKFIFSGTYIYTNGGRVFLPSSQTLVGAFGLASGSVAVDAALNRAYFFSGSNGLSVYDLGTRALLRTTMIPGVSSGFRSKLMRWGVNGLVFIDQSGRVVTLSGPFVTQ